MLYNTLHLVCLVIEFGVIGYFLQFFIYFTVSRTLSLASVTQLQDLFHHTIILLKLKVQVQMSRVRTAVQTIRTLCIRTGAVIIP